MASPNNMRSITSESEEVSKIYGKNFAKQIGTPNRWKALSQRLIRIKVQNKNHYKIFQQTMQLVLFWGQCTGLNPVQGITAKNYLDVRFQSDLFRLWYSVIISLAQGSISCLFLYSLFCKTLTVPGMAFFCFYMSTFLITLLSIQTASKWPTLVREVSTSNLDVNPRIKFKCTLAFAVFVGVAILEHLLAVISNVTFVLDCLDSNGDIYGGYIQHTFSILFIVGLPYHVTVGVCLQFLTIVCVINWNYSDLFIICISIYLTSVLEELNKKIWWTCNKGLPSSNWQVLREAYTRATRLVRVFDNAINHVIFVSFATSLFFICLQLFNVLSNGLKANMAESCVNFPSGPFHGYEHLIYYLVSLLTVLMRALFVALFAAKVHSESRAALPALYEVPTQNYCEEVQRFIEQIHGDTVALTGYNFFNMTRDLILTVAGTIVTYELVLLQFKGENMLSTSKLHSTLRKLNATVKNN